MIFNLEAQGGALRLLEYINKLISRRVIVEVIVKRSDKFRTGEQNRYLHLCLQFFAAQYGCSLEEVKVSFYKKEANADIFIRENDRGNAYLRSSADLSVDEMSQSIDRFRNWSAAVAGIYIPDSSEQARKWMQQEIEKNKAYLW